jgi:hypothetical protein
MTDEYFDTHKNHLRLSDIETTWRRRSDPLRFTMIYGLAIQRYARSIVRQEDRVEDVVQDILAHVTAEGFPTFDPMRGKFRFYLKGIVRHAALKQLTQRSPEQLTEEMTVSAESLEQDWLQCWRKCVLDQALRALERHQREAGRGNLAFIVVQLSSEHPDADSTELARLASAASGQSLSPAAFRKQLSRARWVFAERIVEEVQQTLDHASDTEVRDELAELGLWDYVKEYLP